MTFLCNSRDFVDLFPLLIPYLSLCAFPGATKYKTPISIFRETGFLDAQKPFLILFSLSWGPKKSIGTAILPNIVYKEICWKSMEIPVVRGFGICE